MEGETTNTENKPELGETPRKPCKNCGMFHEPIPRREPSAEELKVQSLEEELGKLRRAKNEVVDQKKLVKARLLLARHEEREARGQKKVTVGSFSEFMNRLLEAQIKQESVSKDSSSSE